MCVVFMSGLRKWGGGGGGGVLTIFEALEVGTSIPYPFNYFE